MQSLELLLDDDLDAAVRGQWAALSAAGLPSQADHTGESNAPHVTLAVASSVPSAVDDALMTPGLPLPITLGALMCFPSRRGQILVRLVVPTVALLAVHEAAAGVFRDLPGSPDNLRVGAWTPHVTLARNLPTQRLGEAIEALGQITDQHGTAKSLRRWDSDRRTTWLVPQSGSRS